MGACCKKLKININAQVAPDLKPLNLFSTSVLNSDLIQQTFDTLQEEGCIGENKVLMGDWVLAYRQDGRFFIVQDMPSKHLTDIALKDLNLTPPTAGICEPHITVNEGQGADIIVAGKAVDRCEALRQRGFVLEPLSADSPIVRDNDMNFDSRNPYSLVRDTNDSVVRFGDIQLTTISVIHNPRPEVQRVFIFKVASKSLEQFKLGPRSLPGEPLRAAAFSIGNEFRAKEFEPSQQRFEDIRQDLGQSGRVRGKRILDGCGLRSD